MGIVATDEARRMAREAELDLVEVAAGAKPPVCRLLDYSKYKYEQEQKQKAARKHQTQVNIREIKLRPKIADNDYNTKKGHVTRFLKAGDKVKVTIMFRGREQAHPERGRDLLYRLFEDLDGLATIESRPLQEGRNMSMLLGPSKDAVKGAEAARAAKANKGKGSKSAEPEEVIPDHPQAVKSDAVAPEPKEVIPDHPQAVKSDAVAPEPEMPDEPGK